MIAPRLIPLVLKQVVRHRVRSLLTIGGVGTAIFLFVAIEAMQRGVQTATQATASDTTLVVYRKDRFCPFTSQLPEYYRTQIARIPGVRAVVPMKVVVSNCRASLDVVTFRGVPRDGGAAELLSRCEVVDGVPDEWSKRTDAALLGDTLARRRGLRPGDRFSASGVTVYVAAVFRSTEPQDQNAAYVHLDFLQQAADRKLGRVTQFNVSITAPEQIEAVAAAIDELFRAAEEPTTTRPEKAFVAQVASDMIDLVSFARVLGWACLLAVLALIGNAIVLSVQGRVKDHAVYQTLGFTSGLVGRLVVVESLILGALGGALGTAGAAIAIWQARLSLSIDGLSMPIAADWNLVALGLAMSITLGTLAGLVPAWQVSRQEIAACFRTV
ncbi:MAG: FtsX-like permease family protein [Lentisphaerae bacterium]|jgi:putative ABC transport system permease protein|nr:FtsX-like permease family protein [Lentisphaerota bacterium]MBT4815860.1 FtsX-like permease family protein [Lentisphaerota bacterium]MBT5610876.1 FtsX-like permease family protein [Lentisphaerota bacterium]MBT7053692.1 FtsX-like permease family protein [Lentisphaerota bacterium]MBT7841153.1 FtsX-like permease family protein [Lentisphaerota bacterium]